MTIDAEEKVRCQFFVIIDGHIFNVAAGIAGFNKDAPEANKSLFIDVFTENPAALHGVPMPTDATDIQAFLWLGNGLQLLEIQSLDLTPEIIRTTPSHFKRVTVVP